MDTEYLFVVHVDHPMLIKLVTAVYNQTLNHKTDSV